jgi:hypothetical protein
MNDVLSARTDSLRSMAINEADLAQWRLLSDEKVRDLHVRVANLERDVQDLKQIVNGLASRSPQ